MKFVSARERGQCGVCNVQIRPDRTSLHSNGWFVEMWFWFQRFGCFLFGKSWTTRSTRGFAYANSGNFCQTSWWWFPTIFWQVADE